MRHGPSYCLETNRVVYSKSDVVRKIIFARFSQDTIAQPPLLIILVSLHYLQDISSLQYFIFLEILAKNKIFFVNSKRQQMVSVQNNNKIVFESLQLCNSKKKTCSFNFYFFPYIYIYIYIYIARHVTCSQPNNQNVC